MTKTNNYEREINQLQLVNKVIKNIETPDTLLNEAIISGMSRGQKRRSSLRLSLRTGLTAVVIVILLTTFIRVSDTFAAYVTKIPGMERFVELIRYDKGLSAALENEYIQMFTDAFVEHDGLKLTIDSIIIDERQMFLFYKLETSAHHEIVFTDGILLTDENGEEIPAAYSYGGEYENLQEVKKPALHRTEFSLNESFSFEELNVTFNFKEGDWSSGVGKELEGDWTIKLPIDKSKIAKSKIYDVNEVVTIADQQITIKQITVYPTRVAVLVAYEPNNTKEIFTIEDLRLVNESGEARTAITDGIMASDVGEYEREFFLQSNYFDENEQLYLRFSTLRALNKDELEIIIDPKREKIIKAPADHYLKEVRLDDGNLVFKLVTEPNNNRLTIPPLIYKGDDSWDGIGYGHDEKGTAQIYLPYSPDKHGQGPLTLMIKDYPARIYGDINLKLK